MNIIKLLILLGAVGFGYQWWNNKQAVVSEARSKSPNGFVSVVMPDGVPRNTVVILAPVNCPSDAAQRADDLARQLTRDGIPNLRSASYSANVIDATREQNLAIERAVQIMNGEIPAVFVNGMGKANPRADEVVSEYRRTKS